MGDISIPTVEPLPMTEPPKYRPKLVSMCEYKLTRNRHDFTEIYLA